MLIITLTEENLDAAIDDGITTLNLGGIIAYPTETFYGLGVKFDMPESLRMLYGLKRRPGEKAMPVIIGEKALLSQLVSEQWLAKAPGRVLSLMERFWPGPLTLLMPAGHGLSEYLTADTGMIAVRIPGESFALRLARRAGFAITATSANLSGMPPADTAKAVTKYFGDGIDLLIDGGQTPGGMPSTIVDASKKRLKLVRKGARGDSIASFINEGHDRG